jgi:hypothetical protein
MTFSINLSVARLSYANLFILTLALSTPLTFAFAGSRAIDHAPIGVMADHMHKSGEWMVSARQMRMEMKSNKIGRNKVSDSQILQIANMHEGPATLKVVPQNMTMDMTMLGVMFAPSDDITLMMMTNYTQKKMTANTYAMMGNAKLGSFTTRSEGLGDTTIAALFNISALPKGEHGKWHGSFGVSLPTGSLKEVDTILTPMNTNQVARLPYAMQLGSGTYDLKPSLTYTADTGDYVYGGQLNATLRLDDNRQGYALGNEVDAKTWMMKSFSDQFSGSLRLEYRRSGTIDGQDPQIDKPIQSAQTQMYGGSLVNFAIGFNFIGHHGWFSGHRLAFEIQKPVYEDLNGPQMSRDTSFNFGYQKAW